jgi:hypothetical protein
MMPMKFLELIAVLEKTTAELAAQCSGIRFVVIANDEERTCFRNTEMTEQECGDLCSQALTLAVFGKGVFIKTKKPENICGALK